MSEVSRIIPSPSEKELVSGGFRGMFRRLFHRGGAVATGERVRPTITATTETDYGTVYHFKNGNYGRARTVKDTDGDDSGLHWHTVVARLNENGEITELHEEGEALYKCTPNGSSLI